MFWRSWCRCGRSDGVGGLLTLPFSIIVFPCVNGLVCSERCWINFNRTFDLSRFCVSIIPQESGSLWIISPRKVNKLSVRTSFCCLLLLSWFIQLEHLRRTFLRSFPRGFRCSIICFSRVFSEFDRSTSLHRSRPICSKEVGPCCSISFFFNKKSSHVPRSRARNRFNGGAGSL